MRLLSVILGLAIVLVAHAPSRVIAQDASLEEARAHFEAGTAAFDTGDYGRAVTEFQASYAITQHPDLLFNVYSAAERDGQYALAAETLSQYLIAGTLETERRAALEQRLARLRERVASGSTEALEPVEGTAEEPVEAEPTAETEPTAEPPVAAASGGGGVHPAGIGLLVGAGVLGLAFAGLAIGSTVEADRLSECSPICTDTQVSTLFALNVAADVSWITAAVAGVVGVVLLFVLPAEDDADAEAARAHLVPWASPDGAGLAIGGQL